MEHDEDMPADLPHDLVIDETLADPEVEDPPIETPVDPPLDPDTVDTPADEPAEILPDTPPDLPTEDGGGETIHASWSFAACPDGWSAAAIGHDDLPSVSWECRWPTTGPGSDHGGGGNLFATRLAITYNWFEWSALTSPAVDLSGVTGTVTLTFWHWYEFEWCTSACGAYNPVPSALDGGNVEVWNGSEWVLVIPEGGYPGTLAFFDSYYTHPQQGDPGYNADGTELAWLQATFDVTAYVNAAFRVRFVFGSDSGVAEDGWYIDDIVITSP